jgi:hypothetical protein
MQNQTNIDGASIQSIVRRPDIVPCQHEYDGSYWIKYGFGWCIEQHCSKCGHREHSHFVGVK